MPDSSDIDSALVAKLAADATLTTLMPGDVWIDEGPPGLTRLVIVSLVDEVDVDKFGGTAFEDGLYLVKAVEKKPATGSGNIKAATARIQVVLHDQPLVVAGYTHMTMHREARVRSTEVDEQDEAIRWWHRGGRYRVQQSV
jgi:hypothetical protein